MAETVGKGVVEVEADVANLGKDISKKVDGQSGVISKAFGGVGKVAGAAFKAAAVAGIAAVAGAVAVGKQSIEAASDLAESMSKVDVVFGDSAKEVQAWSKTSAEAFGQSRQSALEAAGTYGNLFQAFGIGQKPAQEMSQTLVELAADLASFNNTSVEEALDSLRSGLSGETEPLKKYGVAISDVRLKEEALAQGLIKSTKEALTPAAKAQAIYALVMKDTALAQGDFARTSDGLANKQRILGAKFTDLKAKLGKVLLPAFLAVVSLIVDRVFPALEKLGPKLVDAFNSPVVQGALRGLRKAAQAVADWFIDNWPKIRDTVVDVGLKIASIWTDHVQPALLAIGEALFNAFQWVIDHQPVLIGVLAALGVGVVALFTSWAISAGAAAAATIAATAPFIAIGVAIAAVVAGVIYAYQNWEFFRTAVDAVRAWMVDTLWPAIQAVFGWLRDNVPPIMQAVASFFADVVWPAMQKVWDFVVTYLWPAFRAYADFLITFWKTAFETAVTVVTTLWTWLQTLWDRSEGLRSFLASAFVVGVDLVTTAIGAVSTAVSTLWGWLQTLWDRSEGLRAFLAGAFWLAVTVIGTAFDAISTAVSTVWNWFQSVWDKGVEVAGYFKDGFVTAIDIAKAAWEGVSGAISVVFGWLVSIIEKAKSAVEWLGKVKEIALGNSGAAVTNENLDQGKNFDPDGNATGGWVAPHTLTWVGENGPELLQFGSAAGYVTPNYRSDAAAMAAAGDRRYSEMIGLQINGDVKLDGLDVDEFASTINFQLAAA